MSLKSLGLALAVMLAVPGYGQQSQISTARVPELSYRSLDSMICSRELTAVYLWAGWCSACRMNISRFSELMRRFPGLPFLSINDPDSREYLPQRLVDTIAGAAGIFRMARHGREKMFAINDRSQFNYFNRRYGGHQPKLIFIQYLFLFNRTGKVLYSYHDYELNVDSVTNCLQAVLQRGKS